MRDVGALHLGAHDKHQKDAPECGRIVMDSRRIPGHQQRRISHNHHTQNSTLECHLDDNVRDSYLASRRDATMKEITFVCAAYEQKSALALPCCTTICNCVH
jgi:hypothetical protein